MQCVFFEKGICIQWGLGQSPRSWGIFECVKSNFTESLQSVRLLLTVSYRKKIGGAECTSCSPNNFVGEQLGAVAPLLLLRFPRLPESHILAYVSQ